jgi:hypothetical protein
VVLAAQQIRAATPLRKERMGGHRMSKIVSWAWSCLAALAVLTIFQITPARADPCTDGQVMVVHGRETCSCRPPLKYLPGDICGSGKRAAPIHEATPEEKGYLGATTCEEGAIPEASGCRCGAGLVKLANGRCGKPGTKVPMGQEGKPLYKNQCAHGQALASGCQCPPEWGAKRVNGQLACQ